MVTLQSLAFIVIRLLCFNHGANCSSCASRTEASRCRVAISVRVTNVRGPVDETVVAYSNRDGVSIFGFGSRARSCSTCISVQHVRASEEEDVGEARSAPRARCLHCCRSIVKPESEER